MYPNLEAEMVRKKVTRLMLAKRLGKGYGTICQKLAGKNEFTFSEAVAIQELFFSDCDLKTLFEKEDEFAKF